MRREEKEAIDKIAGAFRKLVLEQSNNNDNLEKVLEENGIEITYFDNDDYDAYLEWNKEAKKPIISVNINHWFTRQNFSIAHELGHLLLDYKWIPGKDLSNEDQDVLSIKYRGASSYPKDNNEAKANEFAAAFLMPDTAISNLLPKNNEEINKQLEDNLAFYLANQFDVSVEAARYRLKNYFDLKGIEINE